MKNLFITLLLATLFAACSTSDSDNAAFVTLLGSDTLAVEQLHKTDSSITAQVILRSPETRFSTYHLDLDETGGIKEMVRTDYPPTTGFTGEGAIGQTIIRSGDSLAIEVMRDNEMTSYMAPYQEGVLPFIDMVHWPFEVAFNHAAETGQDSVNQPMLSGNRISNFVIVAIEDDSMTIRHPFRGVMGVNVNPEGNLEFLDAGLTTRKLKVHRVAELDIDALSSRFANNPIGELSGAVSAEFSFKDTDFRVDFGSPQKRDRELFGGVVPYGEVWRTGANRATHFYTSNDLRFGDLEVPAGEYTLFSIPEPDGGTLIINAQTGQNGNSYDESRDLGRVPMEVSTQDEVTEAFTITVEETDEGGRINLIWGDTLYSSDFVIE
ncbi:MAG: DUF2911 domain-containing protein [Gracilimonas sp.]|uniref:DUF2911 domain-containing protein n=1 Tax=Gracilimonas sp. TaxID=1974203 RepID=UPI0019BB6582|nr:DUF2911 domain-containing protein [Gracilimonas sp.]MBD3617320.1 DUF2911 domain-containing protein [Gracilimonas sp.]